MLSIKKKMSAIIAAVLMTATLVTSAGAATVDVNKHEKLVTNNARSFLPLAQYPDGSYFSRTGVKCTCHHKGYNPCSWVTPCDCKNFDNSIQCIAFAKYIYYSVHGYPYKTENKIPVNKNLSGSIAKSYLKGKTIGTYVYGKVGLAPHAIVIVETSENNITFYHANGHGEEPCQVRYESLEWDSFANYFTYLEHYAD